MCGIPGSGKSTWITDMLDTVDFEDEIKVVSRDTIRFSLLKDNEEYFNKEKIVFDKYSTEIYKALKNDKYSDVIADATHLNKASREKILRTLDLTDVDVNIVYFNVSLETCIKRNEMRSGRAYVPPAVIKNMYYSLEYPSEEEIKKHNYNIVMIDEKGNCISVKSYRQVNDNE